MTEAEWLVCKDPELMLSLLRDIASDRKLRLFVCLCCRKLSSRITDSRSCDAVAIAERYAEGLADKHILHAAHAAAEAVLQECGRRQTGTWIPYFSPEWCNFDHAKRLHQVVADVTRNWLGNTAARTCGLGIERNWHIAHLRDIFGNPFRPVAVDPAWRTSDVMTLARGIYEERAFDRLPILADALQDAGCDTDDLLTHLRGPGPHVRGCWALDLVLGKE